MIPLSNEEYESNLNHINCHICKKRFKHKFAFAKNLLKVKHYCDYTGKYRGAAHSICKLKYNIPKEIRGFLTNELRVTIYCKSYELLFIYELRATIYCTSYKLNVSSELRVTIYYMSWDCNVDCVKFLYYTSYSFL